MAEYDAGDLGRAIAAYDAASARYAAAYLARGKRLATEQDLADADYALRLEAQRLRLRLEGLPGRIAAWQRVVGAARPVVDVEYALWRFPDDGPSYVDIGATKALALALAALDGREEEHHG